jgi:hypothetical protein
VRGLQGRGDQAPLLSLQGRALLREGVPEGPLGGAQVGMWLQEWGLLSL